MLDEEVLTLVLYKEFLRDVRYHLLYSLDIYLVMAC